MRPASSDATPWLMHRAQAVYSHPMSDRAAQPSERPTLVRAIGRWALTAGVVNAVIGSGIFGMPAPLAGHLGASSPWAVLLAGAGIFLVVLCFAEVASRFDEAGGPYLYAREAFGSATGFQIGWLHILTRLLSAAAVLNILIAYLSSLISWPGTTVGRAVTMTVGMLIVTGLNLGGVRQATWTVNLFTAAKLLPLLGLIALGMFNLNGDVLASQAVSKPSWTDGVLLLVFAYGGFESAVIAASETHEPKRHTAFALVVAMLSITAIYCLLQLVVVAVLPNASSSAVPVAATLRELLGPVGSTVGSVAVVISVYGWLTGFALMTPRLMFSMAERGELPAFLARVHPRWRTPHNAIIVNSAIALALGLAGGFAQMATFSVISRIAIYAATCAALIALRIRHGNSSDFHVPGGMVVASAGIVFCVWLISTRSLEQAWFLPVVMALGAVVWLLARKSRAELAPK